MTMEKFIPDKEIERFLLLNDPEINNRVETILAMVESRCYWIDAN